MIVDAVLISLLFEISSVYDEQPRAEYRTLWHRARDVNSIRCTTVINDFKIFCHIVNRVLSCLVGVKVGHVQFTCVGWQLTLCDLMWQVTLCSSVMGFLLRGVHHLYIYLYCYCCAFDTGLTGNSLRCMEFHQFVQKYCGRTAAKAHFCRWT